MKYLTLLFLLLLIQPAFAHHSIGQFFGDYEGTFVLYDMSEDTMHIYNPERAFARFAPYSTFKIANTAIALETGVVTDADFVIPYNENRYPYVDSLERFYTPDIWQGDHSLRTAIQYSVVWYYREVAQLIGQDNMSDYLARFDYGNQDISGWLGETPMSGGNPFWLGGSLEINAVEQVQFLHALYTERLGLSESTTATVLDVTTLYQENDYRLYGKTGTRASDLALAWFVGIIEQGDDTFIFAFNVDAAPEIRTRLLRDILIHEGLLPNDSGLFQ